MAKKTIFRSVITLEVLSDEPIPDDISLSSIANECDNGSYSGITDYKVINQPVSGKRAVKLIHAQGSDPEFFMMDENGNDINE
ncbi:MAG TPA: hypothetical protein VK172_10520 [Lentimicrobium sp.]|nr:hypothetical protein [Lentimicrobium sp.]